MAKSGGMNRSAERLTWPSRRPIYISALTDIFQVCQRKNCGPLLVETADDMQFAARTPWQRKVGWSWIETTTPYYSFNSPKIAHVHNLVTLAGVPLFEVL